MSTSPKFLLAAVESDVLALIQDPTLKKKIKTVFSNHAKEVDGPQFNMIKVSSSNIDSIGYNAKNEILRVKFLTGAIYDYLKVSLSEYTNLIGASSVGRYINESIKPNYGTVKIQD